MCVYLFLAYFRFVFRFVIGGIGERDAVLVALVKKAVMALRSVIGLHG